MPARAREVTDVAPQKWDVRPHVECFVARWSADPRDDSTGRLFVPLKQLSFAVLICGVLDIGYAIVTTMLKGGTAGMVLRGVASGPFGDAAKAWGAGGAALGLAVHFGIMAVMVGAYFALVRFTQLGAASPWLAGAGYGLVLFIIMYFVVLPLRWPIAYPLADPGSLAMALLPHVALVGIPLAFIAAQRSQRSPRPIAE